MPDNLVDPGPLDGKLIALGEPHEVAYWTEALNVTPERLEEAVAAAGHSAERVRDWLTEQADGCDTEG